MATTPSAYQFTRGITITLVSSADLTSAIYVFVAGYGSADKQLALCGAGGEALGVLLNSPNTNQPGIVAITGTAPLKLGNTVTRFNKLKSDGSGLGVAATADKEFYGAIALQSGVANDYIEVLITRGFISAS